MKDLKVGPKDSDKVLVVRYKGELRCLGNFCTHFGLPLSKSVLFDDKVLCPFHNAAFSIVTGFPENAPALDGLPIFEVVEKEGKFFAKVPEDLPRKATMPMSKRDPSNKEKVVIIGGGAAGMSAAETLRQADFTGELTILTNEPHVPYDRTLLTKSLDVKPEKIALRSPDFLKEYDIDVSTNSNVSSVDSTNKTVTLADGRIVNYDKLLVATGGAPRRPIIPGIDLNGVHTIRNGDDLIGIKEDAGKAKKIVVMGGSFIGIESASALKMKYKDAVDITVVQLEKVPFGRVFGDEIGAACKKICEEKGIKFQSETLINKISGSEGHVNGVELNNGTCLEADLVIVGAGVQCHTGFLNEQVRLAKDGSVRVDPFLKTSDPDIFAAGDVATYPYWRSGEAIRVEHWNHAIQQGEVAAYNILGKQVPYDSVPFFWTRFFNKSMVYVGNHRDYDEVFIDGDLDKPQFVAHYIKKNKIIATAAFNRGTDAHVIGEAMKARVIPSADKIKSGEVTIADLQKAVVEKGGVSCKRHKCCKKPASN